MAKLNKHDKKHLTNLNLYGKQVEAIYDEAAEEAARLGVDLRGFDPRKPFAFADYPIVQKKAEKLLKWLREGLMATITQGIRQEWALANEKNDDMVLRALGEAAKKLPASIYREYFANNGEAETAFLQRKERGLKLSDRVWNYSEQFKEEIELGLDLGIRSGRSADQIARDIRVYLRAPDKLFRKVKTDMKDPDGKPIYRMSKAAMAYRPGRGVYRSSYKNARRLAATETNMAYRNADHERWQRMDFVIGQHVLLSNNHTLNGKPFKDICDLLSGKDEHDTRGRYPKDFKFMGWHPLCRCHVISILISDEEMKARTRAILNGETWTPPEGITEMPKEFQEWQQKNEARLLRAQDRSTLPYFVRDNMDKFPNLSKAASTALATTTEGSEPKKLTALEVAEKRHAARTPEQVADIRQRAAERQERIERIKTEAKKAIATAKRKGLKVDIVEEALASGNLDTVKSSTATLMGTIDDHNRMVAERAAARHAARTPGQIQELIWRWEERQDRLKIQKSIERTKNVLPHFDEYKDIYKGMVFIGPYNNPKELEQNKRLAILFAEKKHEAVFLHPYIESDTAEQLALRSEYTPSCTYKKKNPDYIISGEIWDAKEKDEDVVKKDSETKIRRSIQRQLREGFEQTPRLIVEYPEVLEWDLIDRAIKGQVNQSDCIVVLAIHRGEWKWIYKRR